jgi:DNA-binding transcriptional LysR family regulator
MTRYELVVAFKEKQLPPADLNLLITLDVILSEGSVTRAAKRLQLSPSAMSRQLSRLRNATGDELLVRAGRGLVPTIRAKAMKQEAHDLVERALALLRPNDRLELATLDRTFTLRTSDGFAETFGPALIELVQNEAPNVRLRFVRKLDKSSEGLRDGSIELETGVVSHAISPEVKAQALFTDRYVGVVRDGHPLSQKLPSLADYASSNHVVAWRQGLDLGGIDELLNETGLVRNVMATVDGFAAALALTRGSDLVATVPECHTAALREGMFTFPIPLRVAEFTISLFWHPRLDADPAHRGLRKCVREACETAMLAADA